jgi:sec-independent protein translocase protein TatC
MSFTGIFGLVVLIICAIALLGPRKLPGGIEQLWLMITNFRRSQANVPPLTLDQARRAWQVSENPLYDLIQILYGAVEHLEELRKRIFIVLGTLVGAGAIAAFFANQVLALLTRLKGDVQLIYIGPTDPIFIYFEVVLSVAVVAAVPIIALQIARFIAPALETKQEIAAFRAITWIGLPLSAVFFVLGLAFAYFFMLPAMLGFLQGFGNQLAKPSWTFRAFYQFILTVLLWIGLAFETPLIMTLLARLGLVSPKAMLKQWRYAFVGIAIMAAIITPTVDPVNMSLVMGPLLVLYFLGIGMARVVYRPKKLEAG